MPPPAFPVDAPWHPDAVARARKAGRAMPRPLRSLAMAAYRVHRLRRIVLRVIRRMEGAPMMSPTHRAILSQFHGVTVGPYSYGAIMTPGILPPGTHIGAYCSVGTDLVVRRRDHPVHRPFLHAAFYNSALGFVAQDTIPLDTENPLSVGHDVWIGDRVTILGGCRKIGNGAVLAAGAVVTGNVAPYTIVAGVPARPLRQRLPDAMVAQLEASAWWERPLEALITADDLPDPFQPAP